MINYKNIIGITLLALLLLTGSAAAQQFDDVPRDHWAYDSVQKLAERGYLSLYSGEDFNGDEALTRYEMAEIIANVLENAVGVGGQDLSEEDVDVIRELSLEFRDELVSVAQRQRDFEERLNNAEDTNQIQDEDIANINLRVSEMQEEVQEIADHITTLAALEEDVKGLDTKITDLEEELTAVKEEGASGQRLEELEDNQSANLNRIEELETRIEELEGDKAAKSEELEEERGSINTGYILGALAILALIL